MTTIIDVRDLVIDAVLKLASAQITLRALRDQQDSKTLIGLSARIKEAESDVSGLYNWFEGDTLAEMVRDAKPASVLYCDYCGKPVEESSNDPTICLHPECDTEAHRYGA